MCFKLDKITIKVLDILEINKPLKVHENSQLILSFK